MTRWHALQQLFLARLREFYREPEAIFWVYGFPLILAIGLGIAFASKKQQPPPVDVVQNQYQAEAERIESVLKKNKFPVEVWSLEQARQRLRTGRIALIVIPGPQSLQYVYDETSDEGVRARYWVDSLLVRGRNPAAVPRITRETRTSEPGNRYIDFLMPGLMGLNLMGGGLWGVGFVLVDMRVRKLLKRFLATPMHRGDFMLSILGARLLFMVPEMIILVLVGVLGFGVPLEGSVATLILVILAGTVAFAGIGLLVACRAEKTETVSGLMNLVMLPMWLLSGTFFSSRRFPEAVQPFIQALPLTQLNDALRAVMLEGASLTAVAWRVGILAAWGVVTFFLALRWFRWQ